MYFWWEKSGSESSSMSSASCLNFLIFFSSKFKYSRYGSKLGYLKPPYLSNWLLFKISTYLISGKNITCKRNNNIFPICLSTWWFSSLTFLSANFFPQLEEFSNMDMLRHDGKGKATVQEVRELKPSCLSVTLNYLYLPNPTDSPVQKWDNHICPGDSSRLLESKSNNDNNNDDTNIHNNIWWALTPLQALWYKLQAFNV